MTLAAFYKSCKIFISFDVISLFTFIPIDLAAKITKNDCIKIFTSTKELTFPLKMYISSRVCAQQQLYFCYQDDHYQHMFGCPMGSAISCYCSEYFYGVCRGPGFTTYLQPPKWWFKYVEDSHGHVCIRKPCVEEFQENLNTITPHI